MCLTAQQWAQAEAERQRQAETLINEVRRLGTEQNNNLQEIQRLRAEQRLPTPPVETSEGACRQERLTRDFSHAPCTCDHTHIVAQGVSGAQSFHPLAIHDVTCLSVRLLSLRVCLFLVSLPLLLFLFHCLLVLCLAQLPQSRHRRG